MLPLSGAGNGGQIVALSARTYARLESCRISYERFVPELPNGRVGEDW